MKRLAYAIVTITVLAGGRLILGQGGGNPFIDHSDTGETVHVLPAPAAVRSPRDTQPTDAPRVPEIGIYSPSYGSGNLTDHGGSEISVASFFAIYYNAAVANSAGTQGQATLRAEVNAFVNGFSNTKNYAQSDQDANYSIVQQYGTAASNPLLVWGGDYVDLASPGGSTLSDSKVRSYLGSLFGAGAIGAPDASRIYGIYFPSGTRITLQGGASCSAFCGYHGHFSYQGTDVKYAVFPYTNCRACSMPGKGIADILTIVTSHEIREAVTDPDLNAWYDASGYEADDKCAWHNLYQTNTGKFWVQPEYSNGGGIYPGPGCIVPLTNGAPR
jgi:hypothetical protein